MCLTFFIKGHLNFLKFYETIWIQKKEKKEISTVSDLVLFWLVKRLPISFYDWAYTVTGNQPGFAGPADSCFLCRCFAAPWTHRQPLVIRGGKQSVSGYDILLQTKAKLNCCPPLKTLKQALSDKQHWEKSKCESVIRGSCLSGSFSEKPNHKQEVKHRWNLTSRP